MLSCVLHSHQRAIGPHPPTHPPSIHHEFRTTPTRPPTLPSPPSYPCRSNDALVDSLATPPEGDAPLRYEDLHVASVPRQLSLLLGRNLKQCEWAVAGRRLLLLLLRRRRRRCSFPSQRSKQRGRGALSSRPGAIYRGGLQF